MWKAIACDLDGTLTNEDHVVDLEVLALLRMAEKSGLRFILSSARTRLELRAVSALFGTTGPIVAENGGIVWNSKAGQEKVLGELRKVQEAYKLISSRITDLQRLMENYRETDIVIWGRRTQEIAPVVESEKLDVHLLEGTYATYITDTSVNKGIGLKTASDMIGIDPSQVAAIEDAQNDIALLKIAGAGYAVGNADQRLKDVATKVMSRPYGGGCADAIREILKAA